VLVENIFQETNTSGKPVAARNKKNKKINTN